jgi:hypothetical protein
MHRINGGAAGVGSMHTEISPWVEKLSPYRLVIAAGAALLLLLAAIAWLAYRWNIAEDRLAILQKQADAGFLQAPSSSRTVRIDLRAPRPVAVGGAGFPERIDLFVNARTGRYARFRMSLLRDDGTLIVRADHVVRDSNNDLRLSFNTSILPAGAYRVRVEGYARGGVLQLMAEARLTSAGR